MAIIKASDHSMSIGSAVAARALQAATARNVASRLINTYQLPTGATAIDLSRFADVGLPDSVSFGVEYTGEAAFGSTATTLTPTRKAKAGTVDKQTYEARVGQGAIEAILAAINALPDAALSDEAIEQEVLAIYSAFGQEIRQLVGSHKEGWEYDTTALFSSVTASAGTSGSNATVSDFLDCLADIEGASSLPHEDIVACLDPQQVADLRAALVGSGASGTPFSENLATILQFRPGIPVDGLKGALLGVPVYQHGPEVRVNANSGADVVGCLFLRGSGDPEMSGNGQPGAFACAVNHPMPMISAQYHGNAFGVRLVVDQSTAFGIRVNGWASKLVTDA